MSDWISVKEKLPPEEDTKYLMTDGKSVEITWGGWLFRMGDDENLLIPCGMTVTHWMPLPKLPKDAGDRI